MRGWGGDKGGTMKKDSRNAGSSRPAEPYAARSRTWLRKPESAR